MAYTCLYSLDHVARSRGLVSIGSDSMLEFLQGSLLFWIETLAWLQVAKPWTPACQINKLRLLPEFDVSSTESCPLSGKFNSIVFQQNRHPELEGAWRFILRNQHIIDIAPLQLYCSALVFSPALSCIRRHFGRFIMPFSTNSSQLHQGHWGTERFLDDAGLDYVLDLSFITAWLSETNLGI